MIKAALYSFFWALIYLIYLMILDYSYVVVFDENNKVIVYMGYLIVTLPFLEACVVYRLLGQERNFLFNLLISSAAFIFYCYVAFFEYLWIATSFHTSIGGRI
jgi:hypothetical protein